MDAVFSSYPWITNAIKILFLFGWVIIMQKGFGCCSRPEKECFER